MVSLTRMAAQPTAAGRPPPPARPAPRCARRCRAGGRRPSPSCSRRGGWRRRPATARHGRRPSSSAVGPHSIRPSMPMRGRVAPGRLRRPPSTIARASSSSRPGRHLREPAVGRAGRPGGRPARTGRRSRSGSAAAPAAGPARPPVTVSNSPSKVTARSVHSRRSSAICSSIAPAAVGEVLAERLVLDRVPAEPTPRRNRPPVSRSTSAACLATSAVWRCGRMITPVTSSSDGERGEVAEQHERLVERGVDVVRARPAARAPPGRRRARGRRPGCARSPAPRPPPRTPGRDRVGPDLGLREHHTDLHATTLAARL